MATPKRGGAPAGAPLSGMAARVKQKAKEAEYSGGTSTLKMKEGVQFYKPTKGDDNEIIIIPFAMSGPNLEKIPAGEQWYRAQMLEHYNIGAENKSVVCPRTIGKKCPICELRAALLDQGKDSKDAEVRALRASKRDLYNVYDLNDEDAGVKLWKFSYHNFGELLEEEIRTAPDTSHIPYFADPENGSILQIRFKEASMGNNKYLEASRIDFNQFDQPMGDLLEEAMPLDTMLVIHSYEELRRMLYDLDEEGAESGDGDEDGGAEEAPAKEQGRSRFSRKPGNKDPEPDGGEDGGEPDPEPAPEKPAGRRSTGRTAAKAPAKEPDPAPEDDGGEDGDDAGADGECPDGGAFGTDVDQRDHCEKCEVWADCRDRADELEKQAPAKAPAKTETKKDAGTGSRPSRRPR